MTQTQRPLTAFFAPRQPTADTPRAHHALPAVNESLVTPVYHVALDAYSAPMGHQHKRQNVYVHDEDDPFPDPFGPNLSQESTSSTVSNSSSLSSNATRDLQYQRAGEPYGQSMIAMSMRVRKAMSNRAAFAAIASAKDMMKQQTEEELKRQQAQLQEPNRRFFQAPTLQKRVRDDEDEEM